MTAVSAIAAMTRRHIEDARKRAAVEMVMTQAQAIVAWHKPEFRRVQGRSPSRHRWRYGINRPKAAALTTAAAMYGAASLGRKA